MEREWREFSGREGSEKNRQRRWKEGHAVKKRREEVEEEEQRKSGRIQEHEMYEFPMPSFISP